MPLYKCACIVILCVPLYELRSPVHAGRSDPLSEATEATDDRYVYSAGMLFKYRQPYTSSAMDISSVRSDHKTLVRKFPNKDKGQNNPKWAT